MANGSDPTSDWNQGYGYQFWRCRPGFYRGDGAHGQFCFVMPQFDAVVAITSGTGDMQSVMNLVWDRIVPALAPSPLLADPAADRGLSGKLASLFPYDLWRPALVADGGHGLGTEISRSPTTSATSSRSPWIRPPRAAIAMRMGGHR